MEIVVTGRRGGKTTACLRWLDLSSQTDSYPFWTHVLLCVDKNQADTLRRLIRERAVARGVSKDELGQYYNQVYHIEDWQQAHLGTKPVKLMFDDADLFLQRMVGGHKHHLVGVTMTSDEENDEKR